MIEALAKEISIFKILVERLRLSILSIYSLVARIIIEEIEKNVFREANTGVIVGVV